jgi:hypothetical protein
MDCSHSQHIGLYIARDAGTSRLTTDIVQSVDKAMTPEVVDLERDLSLALGPDDDLALEVDGELLPGRSVGVELLELGGRQDDGQHAVLETAGEGERKQKRVMLAA